VSNRQILAVVISVVVAVVLILLVRNTFEHLDANQVMVIQSPGGTLTWYTTPGIKWQGFGKVTKYNRRDQFWFSNKSDQGTEADQSIKMRFNDGAHATLSGSISWELPLAQDKLTALHMTYGSQEALEQQLVRTVVEKSIYMTGPLMSSAESYAARRNELLNDIEDQISHGVYRTESHDEEVQDPMTGAKKMVKVVDVVKDSRAVNGAARNEPSPIEEFGIRTYNLSINDVIYDPSVETQIQKQQEATMQVQTAIVNARTAEQDAITAEKKGEAAAAEAKWKQEVIKAQAVTEGEQKLAVAALDAKAAEQEKLAKITRGEGEAKSRQLVMEADGALDKKLDAYIKVNELYADAIGKYQGAWVPSVVMGGQSSVSGGGAMDLIQLLTAKAARDLGLDLTVQAKAKPQQ
jgi:regulator of protease activity HflC (stomatin/prohibitin superfamily)